MFNSIDQTQRNAAKAAGIAYLLTNVLAWFAEFHVRARLIDYHGAAITAANIDSSQYSFRLALAGIVEPRCFIPIGTFELILGAWPLVKGLPRTRDAALETTHA